MGLFSRSSFGVDRENFLRDYYFKICLTPTIEQLFQTSPLTQDGDMFQKVLEQVKVAKPQNTDEDIFCLRYILAKIVEMCLLVNYDGILEYDSLKIAEDMIGHPERDFDWLSRFSRMKKRS